MAQKTLEHRMKITREVCKPTRNGIYIHICREFLHQGSYLHIFCEDTDIQRFPKRICPSRSKSNLSEAVLHLETAKPSVCSGSPCLPIRATHIQIIFHSMQSDTICQSCPQMNGFRKICLRDAPMTLTPRHAARATFTDPVENDSTALVVDVAKSAEPSKTTLATLAADSETCATEDSILAV